MLMLSELITSNETEVKASVGLVNNYRKLVPNVSTAVASFITYFKLT